MAAQRQADHGLDAAFIALSDANRREMVRLLLHKPRRAGELARGIAMSPQALSRHLKVLRKAGLVVEGGISADARVRIYSLHPDAFTGVRDWLSVFEDAWRRQLQSFKTFAEHAQRRRRPKS